MTPTELRAALPHTDLALVAEALAGQLRGEVVTYTYLLHASNASAPTVAAALARMKERRWIVPNNGRGYTVTTRGAAVCSALSRLEEALTHEEPSHEVQS